MSFLDTAQVTLFHGATDTTPREILTLSQALVLVQSDRYRAPILNLRDMLQENPELYRREKAKLDAVTFGGTFSPSRASAHLIQHSAIVCGDIDHLDDLQTTKRVLCADEHTAYCFISPSNVGLKIGVRVEPVSDDAAYKHAWQAIADYHRLRYGVVWDDSGKDIARLCFLSWDKQLYRNEHAQMFSVPPPPPKPQPRPRPLSLSGDEEARAEAALSYIPSDDREIWLAVGMALHDSGEAWGRSLWDRWAQSSAKFDEHDQERTWKGFKANGGVSMGTLFHLAEQFGYSPPRQERTTTPPVNGTRPLQAAPEPDLPPEPVWPECAPEAFSGLAGEIVQTIAPETESDPIAILGQLLVMVGNAIGRTPYFPVEATKHYPTLFLCMVGATSRSRKGTSAAYPKRLLREIDPAHARRVKSGLSSGEGAIWAVRDAVYGHNKKGEEVCEDAGETDKRLCIVESEFARALTKTCQDGNTLSAVLRQAWDCDDILNTLVSGRTRAPVMATEAYISVIAHITASELRRTLTEVEMANGFGNRFLWLCTRRSQLLPEGGNYPDRALAPLRQQLAQAILAARQVAHMTRSDAARLVWRDIYTTLAEGAPGLVGALTARAEAQVLRLSMLYALCDQSAVIEASHLQAAYALWQYCEASARYLFGESLGDPLADSLLQMLRDAGNEGLSRTELYNAFDRHQKSAAIGQALALLLREGFARSAVEKTSGRPTHRWFACAHPPAHKAHKAHKDPVQDTITALNTLNAQPPMQGREVFDL